MKTMIAAALLGAALGFSALPALAAEAGDVTADQCLQCHGPYDALRAKTKDWNRNSGILSRI